MSDVKLYLMGPNKGNILREEDGKPLMCLGDDGNWMDGTGLLETFLDPSSDREVTPVSRAEAEAWYAKRFDKPLPA